MRNDRFRKYWLAGLFLSLATSAYAETWHVTAGDEHATWTVKRSASGSISGKAEMTRPDGTTLSAIVVGSKQFYLNEAIVSTPKQVDKKDVKHGLCIYRIDHENSDTVSGNRHCSYAADIPWSATIEDPTDMTVPVLLKAHEDPRQTEAYKALDQAGIAKLNAKVDEFAGHMRALSAYSGIRDMPCWADQYLYVQLQKPNWTEQEVSAAVEFSCVVPEKVYAHAKLKCESVYKPFATTSFKSAFEAHPDLCSCYAEYYSKEFVAKVVNNTQYESDLGVRSFRQCSK